MEVVARERRAEALGTAAAPGEVGYSRRSWRGLSGGSCGRVEKRWGAEVTEGRGSRGECISELSVRAAFPLDSAQLGPGHCFLHERGNRRRCPERRGQRSPLQENWGGKGK